MNESFALPDALPWGMPAYLLLDGVSMPGLAQQLHRWGNAPYCLYWSTRWQEISDISPYLVALEGPDDPLLAHLVAHAGQEWGYLLFSEADAHALCGHWRRLLSVEHLHGGEVMLRIADPAVMHPLFSLAAQAGSARWFGPLARVCLPDGAAATWTCLERPDPAIAEPAAYRLTEQELTALGEVEFRNFVLRLGEHMHAYFPEFMARFAAHEWRPYVQKIADKAYQRGFCSEQEITLFANVFGYLAGQPVSDFPEIVQLLSEPTSNSPLSRVLRAAELAEHQATDRQGRP
ncbi:DUF4123 domain-containing protein [Pseudomonas sp. GD03860]|uniref:DUF4123 domain-containing protein n=1 Tax=Pseudomonas TaxID=286 RepID=UPI0023637EC7|nr:MULTISPECIES: DUF4123 domain-containing protein [Pseudomonas]MDD2058966.1 DUF4123 domain-containing protein [Pseudomonas putida]MDD2061548.1 DUF4123 domain-containing protein [Pseudomonas putida]MDH0640956.1 DUF4123 domain-containing protein [Pseudomonas sp. GD03860]